MSKLRSFASSVRQRLVPRRYYTEPKDYWEGRHSSFGASLEGVGRLHLSEEDNQRAYEHKWSQVSQVLGKLDVPSGATVLDAGCGTGWITGKLVDEGYVVTAVDFTEAGIDHARSRVDDDRVEWFVSDLARFSPGKSFDLVLCIDVLFHVVDDAVWTASVRNLQALTRPGGHLVIQEHLVDESQVTPSKTDGTVHTRWRSVGSYQRVLEDSRLCDHLHYEVSAEHATKDLLVFQSESSRPDV